MKEGESVKDLLFSSKEQRLSLTTGGMGKIVPGSRGYLRAVFEVDDAWEGCALIVSFSNRRMETAVRLNADRTCMVPDGIADTEFFHVQLIGVKPGFRIQTQPLRVRQGG